MNQKQLFCIAALKIGKDCSKLIRKNLKPGFYLFNNRCRLENDKIVLNPEFNIEDNVYGKNIFLHAIVGMNGCGKSSLLEIIYRMINNFSFFVDQKKRKSSNLLFVCDLDTELYYTINDILYTLVCKKESIHLLERRNDGKDTVISEKLSDIVKITKNFFYTIVTNYSMQSLITSDYKGEICIEKPGVGYTNQKPWIHRIFHKNDGYATAIVLNPYRSEDGWIDAGKEERLTISRLSSLLYYFEKKQKFVDGFSLEKVIFKYDSKYIDDRLHPWLVELARKKYAKNVASKGREKNAELFDFKWNEFIVDIEKSLFNIDAFLKENRYSFFYVIAKEFGYNPDSINDKIVIRSYAYLAYKVLSIASKYSLYSEFKKLGGVLNLGKFSDGNERRLLTLLISKIQKDDKSHITIKVHQVLNFLNNYNKVKHLVSSTKSFSVDDYLKCLNFDPANASLLDLKRHLPPPFFTPSVFLYKNQHIGKKKIGKIPFEKLSSGERQLFSTLSTCVYHMENLMSVESEDIPKYNNVNLIFEEIEISFHPDYQRCFVGNLISMIERLGYNNKFMINIILVTHSPFVLSDVPKQNILYLKDGKDVSDAIRVNPFAANICDVLHQSFFLEDGFIGAFAQKKIDELIELTNGKKKIDKEKIVSHINNLIGEPVIRDYMLNKVSQKE